MEFIRRLIRHIPEKHFKMIRYAGIYARHRESDKHLRRVQIPAHLTMHSAMNWSGFPDVTERVSASADQ